MNDEQLSELEALAEAATPGPWNAGVFEQVLTADATQLVGRVGNRQDAIFVAASRSAIPTLVAEVRRLAAVAESATARAEEMESQRDQLGFMIASLPPEALALAKHIWMTQERGVQP